MFDYATHEYAPASNQRRISCDHPDEEATRLAKVWKVENEASYNRIASLLMQRIRKNPDQKQSVKKARLALDICYSNTLDAAIARELENDFPELDGCLAKRRSKSDGWG